MYVLIILIPKPNLSLSVSEVSSEEVEPFLLPGLRSIQWNSGQMHHKSLMYLTALPMIMSQAKWQNKVRAAIWCIFDEQLFAVMNK